MVSSAPDAVSAVRGTLKGLAGSSLCLCPWRELSGRYLVRWRSVEGDIVSNDMTCTAWELAPRSRLAAHWVLHLEQGERH